MEESQLILEKISIIPFADKFLEESLKLDSPMKDMATCLEQIIDWKSKYKDEMDTSLIQKVNERISVMKVAAKDWFYKQSQEKTKAARSAEQLTVEADLGDNFLNKGAVTKGPAMDMSGKKKT